jgi:hypothetical protein
MARNQTTITDASMAGYFAAIDDDTRRADCEALARLMTEVTGEQAKLWPNAIVGFGSYHYRYDSGHEGDACRTGFASRKGDISIYLMGCAAGQDELLSRLGRHKMGKGCLYVRKLSDVDPHILARLIAGSVADITSRYG